MVTILSSLRWTARTAPATQPAFHRLQSSYPIASGNRVVLPVKGEKWMYTLYGAEHLIAERERESQEISRLRKLEGEARRTSKEVDASQGSGRSLLLREAARASKGPLHKHAVRLGPLSIYW